MSRKPPPLPQRSTEQEIAHIAYQLYQNRQRMGKPGSAAADWATAAEIQQKPLRYWLFWLHQPFIALEKTLWEPILTWSHNQALLSLLGIVGNISLIIAAGAYIGTEKQRRDAEVFNAWQTITSAYGQAGSGGRIQALEFLNASPGANWRRKFPWFCAPLPLCTWPAESLDGIDLSVPAAADGNPRGVYLAEIQLPGASLRSANFSHANVREANLSDADLIYANLSDADLWKVNLSDADLAGVNLSNANVGEANLSDADLAGVNLSNVNLALTNLSAAYMGGANFSAADLGFANLSAADLPEANLSNTDLEYANLSATDFSDANLELANLSKAILLATDLRTARGLTLAQLTGEQAPLICHVALPEDLTDIDPDRDCDAMPPVLANQYTNQDGWLLTLEEAQRLVEEVRAKEWE